jgi:hypothetical protein
MAIQKKTTWTHIINMKTGYCHGDFLSNLEEIKNWSN